METARNGREIFVGYYWWLIVIVLNSRQYGLWELGAWGNKHAKNAAV